MLEPFRCETIVRGRPLDLSDSENDPEASFPEKNQGI